MPSLSSLALSVVAMGLLATLGLIVTGGLDDQSTPIAVSIAGAVTTVAAALAATAKAHTASQDARTASQDARKSARLTELTASQTAALQQTLIAHCGDVCPSATCPLRQEVKS